MQKGNLSVVPQDYEDEPEEQGKCPVCGFPLEECACVEVEYLTYEDYIAEIERTNEELTRALGMVRAERDSLRQILDRLLDGQIETM